MPTQAIIFDLDGTLVDTIPDIAASINSALSEAGLPQHRPDKYRSMVGWGLREAVRRAAFPDVPNPEPDVLDPIVRSAHAAYAAEPAASSVPYSGVVELLEEVSAAGVPMAVLSNKPDDLVQPVMEALFRPGLFGAIRGRVDGVPAKPDPESTVRILGRLGVTPSDALFVGDSEVDMETALRAGCVPVGVAWGFRDPADVQRSGAAYMIESVPALRTFLLERTTGKGVDDDTR